MTSPPPPPPLSSSLKEFRPNLLACIITLLCLCAGIVLVVLDLKTAFKKRANWLPGKALVLSALTIQVLSFVSATNIKLAYDLPEEEDADWCVRLFIMDVGTLNICVFLAYFLPEMVGRRPLHNLGAIAALVIALFFPVKNLFAADESRENGKRQSVIGDVFFYETLALICIIFLIVLLGCTLLAGKALRRILRQRISAILATEDARMRCSWNAFEDELFKSWIVVRASQPNYVIARSVLTSAAGLVVTIFIIIYIVQDTSLFFFYRSDFTKLSFSFWVSLSLFFILFAFVLVGWAVICWRWFSALLQFPWHPKQFACKRCFWVEDFWTRSLVDMIHKYDAKDCASGYINRSCFSITKFRLHKLLHLLRLLQILIVLITKICWLLSEMVLGLLMRLCWLLCELVLHKFMRWCNKRAKTEEDRFVYNKYSKIIEPICMPGEHPLDLWEANKGAINRITHLFKKGCEDGSQCGKAKCFTPFSMEWVVEGFQLLDKLREESLPQVVRYFPNLEKQCWKMTAVSFIVIILEPQKVKSDRVANAVKACSQVWDLLGFVDNLDCHLQGDGFDTDTDEVSKAADKKFVRLQQLYDKLPRVAQGSSHEITIEFAKNLSEKPKRLLEREKLLEETKGNSNRNSDTKDCMKIAPSYNLYKLCKVMEAELNADKVEDLMDWAERSLRNLIVCCLSKIPDMLVKHCRIWAERFDEDKIWEAIYIAGKARGMMESWRLQLQRSSESREVKWTIQVSSSPEDEESITAPLLNTK